VLNESPNAEGPGGTPAVFPGDYALLRKFAIPDCPEGIESDGRPHGAAMWPEGDGGRRTPTPDAARFLEAMIARREVREKER
jgi:hypothetical protein